MTGLIILGIVTTICCCASCHGGKGAAGFLFFVWGLVLLVLLISPPVAWIFIVGFAVLMAVLASRAVKSRRAALVSLFATTIVVLACGAKWHSRYRELAALRDEYPAVSVSERLAYEDQGHVPAERGAEDPESVANRDDRELPEPIAGELARLEERLNNWESSDWQLRRRTRALARLSTIHERMVYQFSIASGFGVSRMSPGNIYREDVTIPELPSLAVPGIPESTYGETPSELVNFDQGEIRLPEHEDPVAADREVLRGVHEAGVADFSNRGGFGFVASRENVFGFQPHGFRKQPTLPDGSNASSRWQISNLELVSLLKHDVPAAYVSKNLPRMDELAQAPTRSLDAFETAALGQLRSGEEIVVEEDAGELRMLGSLRAAKQCIECHSVRRGDLLGAFTYHLRRDLPLHKRPVAAAKPVF